MTSKWTFDNALSLIEEKRWDAIKSEWLRYLPTDINNHIASEETFEDLVPLCDAVAKINSDKSGYGNFEIPAIREAIISRRCF